MRKLRKQPIRRYNPYDQHLESGNRVFVPDIASGGAYMYDVIERTGILTYRVAKKNGFPRLAILSCEGVWYWDD